MTALSRALQIFLGSFVLVYLIVSSLQITQVDIWWHLQEGLRLLQTFHLPVAPAAAFGLSQQPYFDEYAGYEVVLRLLYDVAGFPGLWMAFSAIYLLILFLSLTSSREKYPAFDFLSTVSLLLAGLLLKDRLEERPELVGVLLLVLLLRLLRGARLEAIPSRSYLFLFLIFAVWTNTHSTFVIGLFALGLWIGCEIILKARRAPWPTLARTTALLLGTALLATMLNPYGHRRLLFPFIQALDPGSTALSPEMWPLTDFHSTIGIMVLVAAGLLVVGILTTRGMPLWLILFSIFSFYMAVRNFRSISLLGISLLFVYSARGAQPRTLGIAWPWPVVLMRTLLLCFLCTFMLYAGGFSLLWLYNEVRHQPRLATNANRFAGDVVEVARAGAGAGASIPVLCGHGEGAYLSFAENGPFHPLLDSGLAHFSDAAKRYFFFIWHEPEAFRYALENLHVDDVILNKETFHWIMGLRHAPHWRFILCTENGMLWRREGSDSPGGLSPANLAQIERSRDALLQNNDLIGAFCYSTLLERPVESLRLIGRYGGPEWSESFFNYFSFWVASLPDDTIRQFLADDGAKAYPLVDAILWARLGPPAFDAYDGKVTAPAAKSWQWKLVEVRVRLAEGRTDEARTIFNSISPRPISSISYYDLWQELNSSAGGKDAGGYGDWQMWNDDSRAFLRATTAQLNGNIAGTAGAR